MDVKSIAIIGAGSAGLAAAKYLLAEKKFSRIVIYEQRASTGGVWNTSPLQQEPGFSIPRASPSSAHEYAVVERDPPRDGHGDDARVALVSPIYDDLETNIPHSLMRYTDLAFPAGTPLFPAHETVLAYLRRYGQDVEHLASFATQVRDVRKTVTDDGTRRAWWRVEVQDIKSGAVSAERFDAVVVASGHYSDPFVPDVPGIAAFEAAHPGAIMHSKFYRRPAQFTGKKVLVVGNSASGIDISRQIATVARLPVLISEKDTPGYDDDLPPAPTTTWSRHVGQVASFLLPATRSVRFTSGHVENNIDFVVFCTGYHYSFPFLPSLDPAVLAPDGTYADHLWEHMLYVPDPTLAFLAVPKRVVPFPLAEAQAAVIARLWAGRLHVPPEEEREAWVRRRRGESAPAGARHTLGYPQDAEYINRLHALSKEARPARGLERDGAGKEPPFWDDETSWVRSQIFPIKLASRELGERRKECKTLADLGFDFHAAKENGTSTEST